jgi:hypothetical protein
MSRTNMFILLNICTGYPIYANYHKISKDIVNNGNIMVYETRGIFILI